jgi:hypothetical protein
MKNGKGYYVYDSQRNAARDPVVEARIREMMAAAGKSAKQ